RAAFSVENLRAGTAGPVSFNVGAGEIVGLAGLRGAGHETVGRVLGGVLSRSAGTIMVDGSEAALGSPGEAIKAGLSFTSGKRAEEGLAGTLSVKENLFLNPL